MRRNRLAWIVSAVVAVLAADRARGQDVTADFVLPDVVSGKDVRFADGKGTIRVLLFYSHTCTFCRDYEERIRQLAADGANKAVTFYAIDSTGGSAEEAASAWKRKQMGFPLLRDASARVAAALGASALTTVCILDARGQRRYLGAFDDSESGTEVRCRFAADAVAALLAGKSVPRDRTEVFGCMIPLPK